MALIFCKRALIIVALLIVIFMPVTSSAQDEYRSEYEPLIIQDSMHRIAEYARALGLPEDDPIIIRAKELWLKADKDFHRDRDIVATVVYNEAGNGCSDRHMELVAAVVYNRLMSEKFPDTIRDIVVAPKQYHPDYVDADSYYGKRARESSEKWEKCQEIATKALKGEIECPRDVYYQANFKQGKGIYEIHYTTYSTTWFCYG